MALKIKTEEREKKGVSIFLSPYVHSQQGVANQRPVCSTAGQKEMLRGS
jgi:hypothetical protein